MVDHIRHRITSVKNLFPCKIFCQLWLLSFLYLLSSMISETVPVSGQVLRSSKDFIFGNANEWESWFFKQIILWRDKYLRNNEHHPGCSNTQKNNNKKVALGKWHQLLEVNARLPDKQKKKAALSKWHKLLEATVQLGKVKFSS